MRTDIHQTVTDQIIAAIEAGQTGPWTCPWHRIGSGLPANAVTGKAYRGINVVALWCAAITNDFPDQRWATYRQWAAAGAQVRRGERGTTVVFFREIEVLGSNPDDDGRRLVARASVVFNAAQVDGASPIETATKQDFDPVERADSLIAASGVPILHGGDKACFVPSQDMIRLPPREAFRTRDGYYGTAFHELSHATGHESRLARDLSGRFGSSAYAMEELVAELGASFVMAGLGLAPEPHPDTVAYLASWLDVLKAGNRAIFSAASHASRAADYLTVRQAQDEP